MRLLQLQADGGFRLVECVGRDIRRYAILLHIWGADDDEVTYKDVVEGVGEGKAGHRKLTLCSHNHRVCIRSVRDGASPNIPLDGF